MIAIGSKVFLRACPFGEPGRVLRVERGRLAVLWPDLGPTYIARHLIGSLMEAQHAPSSGQNQSQLDLMQNAARKENANGR